MQWTYNGEKIEELPDNIEGFVYLITNTTNNRKYIGKKLAKFKKTKPPLKGKKNKRRSKIESDWRDYWGSSDHLIADKNALDHNGQLLKPQRPLLSNVQRPPFTYLTS